MVGRRYITHRSLGCWIKGSKDTILFSICTKYTIISISYINELFINFMITIFFYRYVLSEWKGTPSAEAEPRAPASDAFIYSRFSFAAHLRSNVFFTNINSIICHTGISREAWDLAWLPSSCNRHSTVRCRAEPRKTLRLTSPRPRRARRGRWDQRPALLTAYVKLIQYKQNYIILLTKQS